jgi:hypothetical protein
MFERCFLPPSSGQLSLRLHNTTTYQMAVFLLTAVRTSNLTEAVGSAVYYGDNKPNIV